MNQKRHYMQRRVIDPLVALLKQGLSPRKLAQTVAVGVGLSLCPFVGTTTITCTGAAFAFRLNLAAIQVVNYAVFPLQLILMLPFIQVGIWLFGADPLPFGQAEFYALLESSPWEVVSRLWQYLLMGVAVWAISLLPLIWGLFHLLLPIFRRVAAARATVKAE